MKNLIFICIDGLRKDCITEQTENLYNFCKSGTTLTNVISCHPLEESYFASLITGKHFTQTGTFKNGLRVYPDHDTFIKSLTDNGYSTAFIGKWPLYGSKLFVPKGRYRMGFDDVFVSFERHKNKTFYCADTPDKQPVSESDITAQIKMMNEAVARFAKSGSPYAVFLTICIPFKKSSDYLSAVKAVDADIAELLTIKKNTITVVTSSLGTALNGEKPFSNDIVNVPFFIAGDSIPVGETSTLVGTTDIMPSILSLTNVPSPVGIDGKSRSIFSSVDDGHSVLLVGTERGKEWRGLRNRDFTYIIDKKHGREQLFDNIGDPSFENDLSAEKSIDVVRNDMKRNLYKKMLEISDTFANNGYYKKYWLSDGKVRPVLK